MFQNVKVTEAEKLEERVDEVFGLAPSQGVLETKEASELHDTIRVTTRNASLAGLSRLPGAKKVGREMNGQGASLNKATLLGSPVAILKRVLWEGWTFERFIGQASSAFHRDPSVEICTNAVKPFFI